MLMLISYNTNTLRARQNKNISINVIIIFGKMYNQTKMYQDNKKSNTQLTHSDYSFILDSSSNEKPRSNNKKMVIIILLMALLSVATVAYLLQSSTNNVQKTDSNQTFSSQEIASQKEVAKNFIDLMTKESFSEARSLLSKTHQRTDAQLKSEYNNFWKNLAPDTCKASDDKATSSDVRFQCTLNSTPATIIFKFTKDGNSFKIDSYSIIVSLGKTDE